MAGRLGSPALKADGRDYLVDGISTLIVLAGLIGAYFEVALDKYAALAGKGAEIGTCHTTEYTRGTEGCEYLHGVKRGNVGISLTRKQASGNALACTFIFNRAPRQN